MRLPESGLGSTGSSSSPSCSSSMVWSAMKRCSWQIVIGCSTSCQLHRFMADQTIDEEQEGELLLPVEPKPDSGKRIAIVGGGPAGLAAAFYARLEGHAVKIFEALPKPGGMLRYGIPS